MHKAKRNVTTAKGHKNPKTNIILAAATSSPKVRIANKSLIKISNFRTIIDHQISCIKRNFPKSSLFIILGYEADILEKKIKEKAKIIRNELFEKTNITYGINLVLDNINNRVERLIIIHGDLLFNSNAISQLSSNKSSIVIDLDNQISANKIGVNVINNKVQRFGYGLPIKWGKIASLTNKELNLFKNIVKESRTKNYFLFEILNEILDQKGSFTALSPQRMRLLEIDSPKDVHKARSIKWM